MLPFLLSTHLVIYCLKLTRPSSLVTTSREPMLYFRLLCSLQAAFHFIFVTASGRYFFFVILILHMRNGETEKLGNYRFRMEEQVGKKPGLLTMCS